MKLRPRFQEGVLRAFQKGSRLRDDVRLRSVHLHGKS